MIGALKGVALVVDYIVESAIRESLLVAPLSITIIVILGLVSFGADDFLDFLNAYFIELGIMMVERPYVTPIAEIVIDYLEEKVPMLGDALRGFYNPAEEEKDK